MTASFLGNNKEPKNIIENVIKRLKRPISSGLRFIAKDSLIGSIPINAYKPPIKAKIAQVSDAFFQYNPPIRTAIAPEK